MKSIRWPNGQIDTAQTFEQLEEKIMRAQWQEYQGKEEFREDMARRARYWSGIEIDVDGSSYDFLFELERAGMLVVIAFTDVEVVRCQA